MNDSLAIERPETSRKRQFDWRQDLRLSSKPWVVIPAWNEAVRLPPVLQQLTTGSWNVVVVDDGSTDPTAEVAKRANVWVLRHLVNRGQGAALRTGILFALSRGAERIVTFDADGQHRAEDIAPLLGALAEQQADLALGSRFLGSAPGIPWTRWLLLKAAVIFTRLTTGMRLTDAHNGLRAMTRTAAERLAFSEDGMAHASQILSLASIHQLRVVEVPCTIQYSVETMAKGQRNSAAIKILSRLLISRITR